MKRMLISIFSAAAFLLAQDMDARRFSVSTNMLGYLYLGTFNLETSYGFSRHWSLTAGAEFNPFAFRMQGGDRQFQSRQQSYELGARYWPWHVYSGWWVAAKARYREYNHGGLFSLKTEEGDGFGIGLSAGYSYMIHPRLNLEFGLGLWSGVRKFTLYDCPSCGNTLDSGVKGFILPDELLLSLVYVF